jgi:hypothetical protein
VLLWIGKWTVFGLFCGLDTAVCVGLEWEKGQRLVYFVDLILLSV